jgi:hypothetical protein
VPTTLRQRGIRWGLIAIYALAAEHIAQGQQGASKAERPVQPQVEAATVYNATQGPRLLTVWRRHLGDPPPAITLRYLKSHPDRNAVPNTMLYAIDAPVSSPADGRLAWIYYDYAASNARPAPVWSADVAVDPATRQSYVAVLKSVGFHSEIALFEIPKESSIAASAANLAFESVEQWPAAAKPLSSVRKDMGTEQPCGLSSIRLTAIPKGLIITALRERQSCQPVYMEYAAESRDWREMALVPSPAR